MTFLGVCTRRLLSSEQTWPSAHLFRRTTLRINSQVSSLLPSSNSSCRHHSTIYERLRRQKVKPDSEAFAKFTNKLRYVLRRMAGREYGLENRDDDYVSVKKLLNHPEFQEINMPTLQKIIDSDIKHRFAIKYDPTKQEDCWWIRAKRWKERYYFLKPITPGLKVISHAVYRTTLQEWNDHISENGIPRLHEEYIRLECGIFTETYLDDLKSLDELFIFVDVEACMDAGIRFFTPTPTPQPLAKPSYLLTKGDEYGFIPEKFIVEADRVKTEKTLLWGDLDPLMRQVVNVEPDKAAFLPVLDENLTGFVDYPPTHRPHPETVEEAKSLLTKP